MKRCPGVQALYTGLTPAQVDVRRWRHAFLCICIRPVAEIPRLLILLRSPESEHETLCRMCRTQADACDKAAGIEAVSRNNLGSLKSKPLGRPRRRTYGLRYTREVYRGYFRNQSSIATESNNTAAAEAGRLHLQNEGPKVHSRKIELRPLHARHARPWPWQLYATRQA